MLTHVPFSLWLDGSVDKRFSCASSFLLLAGRPDCQGHDVEERSG